MMLEVTHAMILGGLGLAQGIAVAIIAGVFNRESKRRRVANERHDKHNAIQAEERHLSMRMMSASISLGCAIAYAQKEDRVNGKTESALAQAEEAQNKYFNFVNRIASEQMTRN